MSKGYMFLLAICCIVLFSLMSFAVLLIIFDDLPLTTFFENDTNVAVVTFDEIDENNYDYYFTYSINIENTNIEAVSYLISLPYTSHEEIYIHQITALFDNIQGDIVGTVASQYLNVQKKYGDWIKINLDNYEGWVYLNFSKENIIKEFMASLYGFSDIVAVYYENLASGFSFNHNAERQFFAASASKLPFALYIYDKLENGQSNINSRHIFTEEDYWGGSGFIRHRYEFGQEFSQRQLLHLMISPSDNIATRMLRRIHGISGYRSFMENIGGNTHFVQNITYAYLSANEAGLIARHVYGFIAEDGVYSRDFQQNLLHNRYPFIISSYPVASKSGWAASFGGAFHDIAIVYAPSVYTLSILSNLDGTATDRYIFEKISMFFQNFNDMWFN